MINLKDILYKVTLNAVVGNTNVDIVNMHFDSRSITKDDVFIAINGSVVNGHDYIETAVKQGAVAIVCEVLPNNLVNGVTYVEVENSSQALSMMASNYYKVPSENLKLVGITGTIGITTMATV